MKTIYWAILVLCTSHAFANEYYTVSSDIRCQMSADVQTVLEEKKALPDSIVFTFNISERRYKTGKGLDKVKVARRTTELSKEAPLSIKAASLIDTIKFEFEDLSRNDFEELLKKMGDTSEVPPAKGVKNLSFEMIRGFWVVDLKKQIHYKVNQNDGLSYHLHLKCTHL